MAVVLVSLTSPAVYGKFNFVFFDSLHVKTRVVIAVAEMGLVLYIYIYRLDTCILILHLVIDTLVIDEDLTGSRDGGIIRRILEKGTGDSSPNHGALVTG